MTLVIYVSFNKCHIRVTYILSFNFSTYIHIMYMIYLLLRLYRLRFNIFLTVPLLRAGVVGLLDDAAGPPPMLPKAPMTPPIRSGNLLMIS